MSDTVVIFFGLSRWIEPRSSTSPPFALSRSPPGLPGLRSPSPASAPTPPHAPAHQLLPRPRSPGASIEYATNQQGATWKVRVMRFPGMRTCFAIIPTRPLKERVKSPRPIRCCPCPAAHVSRLTFLQIRRRGRRDAPRAGPEQKEVHVLDRRPIHARRHHVRLIGSALRSTRPSAS